MFPLSYRNTHESLGELKKTMETLSCSLCSHSISCSLNYNYNLIETQCTFSISYFSNFSDFYLIFQYDLDDPERGMIFVCSATHKTKVHLKNITVSYNHRTLHNCMWLFCSALLPKNLEQNVQVKHSQDCMASVIHVDVCMPLSSYWLIAVLTIMFILINFVECVHCSLALK